MDLTNINQGTIWQALHNVSGHKGKYDEYGIRPFGIYGQGGNTKFIRNINRCPIIASLSFFFPVSYQCDYVPTIVPGCFFLLFHLIPICELSIHFLILQ